MVEQVTVNHRVGGSSPSSGVLVRAGRVPGGPLLHSMLHPQPPPRCRRSLVLDTPRLGQEVAGLSQLVAVFPVVAGSGAGTCSAEIGRLTLCIAIVAAVARCGGGSPTSDSDTPTPPVESPTPPVDSTPTPPEPPTPPPDTVTPPPPGTPPDTTTPPPPDTTTPPPPPPPLPPAPPAVHRGIPFGPMVYTKGSSSLSRVPPVGLNPAFTGLVNDAHRPIIMAKLEEARRTNGRVLVSFSGSGGKFTDANGFNLTKWKQFVGRVPRARLLALYLRRHAHGQFHHGRAERSQQLERPRGVARGHR